MICFSIGSAMKFIMLRFYGAKPELWEKKWVLGDPELVN